MMYFMVCLFNFMCFYLCGVFLFMCACVEMLHIKHTKNI